MSGKLLFVAFALLFAQLASARVARDAPSEPIKDPFLELMGKASELYKDVQGKIFEAAGVKDQNEFNAYLAKETKTLASQLEGYAKDLKKTTEENVEKLGESDAVKQLRSRIDEAVNKLKNENPEAAKNVEELTKTTKSLVEGISKLGDSDSAKEIKNIGNQILETTVNAMKEVNNKIQEAAKQ